ncbi:MAG: peptidylprolyl isomerase [Pseudomonadota bacterium]
MNPIFLFSFLVILFVNPAQAKQFDIAATVNDDAISASDVDDRLKLFFASSGMPPTKENEQRAKEQVLDVLIEEQLKIQEALRNNIEISDEEVEEGFVNLAAQNGLEAEDFAKALQSQKIPRSTLLKQIRAQISWSKVVRSVLRPQINITEVDVKARLERMTQNMGSDEYRVSEIFIPVQDEAKEDEMMDLAKKLIGEIQAGRAPFGLVAAQFSKSESAQAGGVIGWKTPDELPKELSLVLKTMEEDQISPPIRTMTGVTVLKVDEKRIKSEENLPEEEEVLNAIGLERLDRLQSRHLSDLKAAAFIDRRL